MPLEVLSVTPELFPLIKTGGLADVAAALPAALAPLGVRTRTLLPAYPAVLQALPDAAPLSELLVFDRPGRLLQAQTADSSELLLLDLPAFYERPGSPYAAPFGQDWPDNPFRFAALAHTAARIGLGLLPDWRPQIVHAHDWPAGLAPAYLALWGDGQRPRTVQTIHNLAFQGQCDAGLVPALDLPWRAYDPDGLEYYGSLGFLKAGLFYADRITTVSPTYAREIQGMPAGMGMQGLLRSRAADLHGIVNGLDTGAWDPARDPHLPAPYTADDPGGKGRCKTVLQEQLGLLVEPRAPVFGVVSRLTEQKGLDLLLPLLPELVARGGQLVLLGSGDRALEDGFRDAMAAHPGRVACRFGYDEGLAHLIQAGSDVVLVPSRFEPCGLTQLAALHYGALPLVARVGGLADTVIDASMAALHDGVATGFLFAPVTVEALRDALDRAFGLWADPPAWETVRRRAMTREVGWKAPARAYARLYGELLATRAAPKGEIGEEVTPR